MPRERFSTYDERSERRGAHSGRASNSDLRHMRRQARERDNELADMYEAGREEAKEEAKEQRKARAKSKVRKSTKRTVRKFTDPVQQGTDQGVRQLQAPVRSQVASGMRTIGLCLAVVALYLFLNSADKVVTGLDGVKRALDWLQAPDRSIPLVKES